MVLVASQLHLSLVLSHRHSFDLFIRCLFSSLPVPLPVNIRSSDIVLFSSLPIPFPYNICIIVCSLFSSLPDPFPDNSVLLSVWICLAPIIACPRLRLQPNPLVPSPCDSRLRPTPVYWTCHWITLDITVCQRTILDCCLSLEVCLNKEHYFFIPEFCLAISSCYPNLTDPKHTSKTTKDWLKRKRIRTLDWPPGPQSYRNVVARPEAAGTCQMSLQPLSTGWVLQKSPTADARDWSVVTEDVWLK